ncbi:MAG: serine hydrolase domain-containing protein [Planctomycetota bacterium]
MTESKKQPKRKRRFVWISVLAVLTAFSAASYFAFEPEITWYFGWRELPEFDAVAGEESESPPDFADLIAFANSHLEEQKQSRQLPALSVAIGLDGKLLWSRAMGPIGLEPESLERPISTGTQFRIGSISKSITGTLAVRLAQQGELDLNQPVSTLVPYFPRKPHEITTRQLLTHTAGIRNYGMRLAFPASEFASNSRFESVESAVAVFADDPLEFVPGSDFRYSAYGYVLASAALEGATALTFPDLIASRLTEPLGMSATVVEAQAGDDFAQPYEFSDGLYKPALHVDTSNKIAAGGLVSTPTDLVTFGNAILVGDYLSEPTKQEMIFKPHRLSNGDVNEQAYAFGWRVNDSEMFFQGERTIRIVHHGGMAMGGTAFLVLFPDQNLTMAIATNRSLGSSGELLQLLVPIAERLIVAAEAQ